VTILQHRFNSDVSATAYVKEVEILENVFANIGAAIDINSVVEKTQTLMRHAFVFITVEPDSTKSALEDLKNVAGVVELYNSRGAYDIIAKVSGESLEDLRDVVFKQIQNLDNITSTLTLMLV
jgi:DNA-binding Lrp family transcriptional regulator